MAEEPAVLIIGAGTFGTSTAYHLSQKYKDASRVTIIDQAPSPPTPAAAIDVNRIIRTDYPSTLYCNLANEAIHSWFWQIELQRYFHKVGWVYMDEAGSEHSKNVAEVFKNRGADPTDEIKLDGLGERWNFFKGTDTQGFDRAYYNPEAGWVDAAAATASLLRTAEKKGVKRVTGRVSELLFEQGRINGARNIGGQDYTADIVILAAGAWTSSLLSPLEDILNIPDEDRIEHQVKAVGRVAAYYKVSNDITEQCSRYRVPVLCYGLKGEVIPPSKENKILTHRNSETTFTNTITTKSGRKISVPRSQDHEDQKAVPESLKRETEAVITSKVVKDLVGRDKQADHWRICWDAITPTEDFLLSKHPHEKLGNLYLAVGGSFHSYKFLPNIGKYMVNVLEGKSNGAEKDNAWAWKQGAEWTGVANEKAKQGPRELSEYVDRSENSSSKARL